MGIIDGIVYVLLACQYQITTGSGARVCIDGGTPYLYETLAEMKGAYELLSPAQKETSLMGRFQTMVPYSTGEIVEVDKESPQAVSGVSASAVSSTSITLTWLKGIDDKGVQGYTVRENEVPLVFTRDLTFLREGLIPATTYHYSVSAHDRFNEGVIGNGVYVVTPQDAVDRTPPSCNFTTPTANAVFYSTVSLRVNSNDSGTGATGVNRVEFFVETFPIKTDPIAPFTAEWEPLLWESGVYTLTAIATDNAGNIRACPPVVVTYRKEE